MKALLWALYLPYYSDILIEVPVGDRFKPDLVALDAKGYPTFWAEAGYFRAEKIRYLVNHYKDTHVALAKWDSYLDPFVGMVMKRATDARRTRPVDLLKFPHDSADRFLDDAGVIRVTLDDIEWVRLAPS